MKGRTHFVYIFCGVINEIRKLIENEGRIQLITSPNFSTKYKIILEKSVNEKEVMIAETFLNDRRNDVDETKQNFTKLMAYMMVNEIQGRPQLEIKIAIPTKRTGLFHQKLGNMHYSEIQKVIFSGSVNETATG